MVTSKKDLFKNYYQHKKRTIYETSTIYKPSIKIPCRLFTPSRLFSVCRKEGIKEFAHFFEIQNCNSKHVLFVEYVGNNKSTISNLEQLMSLNTEIFFVLDDTYEGLLTQEEVDEIINLCNQKNIPYIFYSSNEKLKGPQVYFFSYHLLYDVYDNINVQSDIVNLNLFPRQKKFLCMNREARFHRLEIVDHFLKKDLLKHSFVSCFSRYWQDIETTVVQQEQALKYQSQTYLDENILYKNLPDESIERLKSYLPLHLDLNAGHPQEKSRHLPNPKKYYENSYWSIVGERDFYDDRYQGWTEKVLKCFFFYHPFVIVGLPHTLKSLQELGFITFGHVIDETYDQIEDHEKRMTAVKSQIDYLSNLNYAEHFNLYQQLLPILKHNRQHYLNLNLNYKPSIFINQVLEWYYHS